MTHAQNILLGVIFSLLLWSLFLTSAVSPDFTDTGVGCVSDCLEPAEER